MAQNPDDPVGGVSCRVRSSLPRPPPGWCKADPRRATTLSPPQPVRPAHPLNANAANPRRGNLQRMLDGRRGESPAGVAAGGAPRRPGSAARGEGSAALCRQPESPHKQRVSGCQSFLRDEKPQRHPPQLRDLETPTGGRPPALLRLQRRQGKRAERAFFRARSQQRRRWLEGGGQHCSNTAAWARLFRGAQTPPARVGAFNVHMQGVATRQGSARAHQIGSLSAPGRLPAAFRLRAVQRVNSARATYRFVSTRATATQDAPRCAPGPLAGGSVASPTGGV